MEISQYQVGQKPAHPLAIQVYDSNGRPANLAGYDTYKVRLIGSRDEEVDLGNAELQTTRARDGRFVFVWPTDRSLFDRAGEYLLQLELSGGGHTDFTTTHTIRVRAVGRRVA